MQIIAFSNQKGGCGKTSSAFHLAIGLGNKGYKVLMCDLDPQSNLALSANVDLLNMKKTLYDVFKRKATAEEIIIPVRVGVDILVGGLGLTAADMEFTAQGREFMLRECLETLQTRYDYCIIDTSPSLSVMTMNALTAADKVVIPLQTDIYALQGMSQLNGFIKNIQKYSNRDLIVDGLLITRYSERTTLTQALKEQIDNIAAAMQTRVYDVKIRNTVEVGKAALLHSDLYEVASNSTAALDYKVFVDEFLKH